MRACFGAFHHRVTCIQSCKMNFIESNSLVTENPLHNPLQELIGSCESDSQTPPTERGCMRSGSLDELAPKGSISIPSDFFIITLTQAHMIPGHSLSIGVRVLDGLIRFSE